jgi:hypothetical protein
MFTASSTLTNTQSFIVVAIGAIVLMICSYTIYRGLEMVAKAITNKK